MNSIKENGRSVMISIYVSLHLLTCLVIRSKAGLRLYAFVTQELTLRPKRIDDWRRYFLFFLKIKFCFQVLIQIAFEIFVKNFFEMYKKTAINYTGFAQKEKRSRFYEIWRCVR